MPLIVEWRGLDCIVSYLMDDYGIAEKELYKRGRRLPRDYRVTEATLIVADLIDLHN